MRYGTKFLLKALLIFLIAWLALLGINYNYQKSEFSASRKEALNYNVNIFNESIEITRNNLVVTAKNIVNVFDSLADVSDKNQRVVEALDTIWATLRRQDPNYVVEYFSAEGILEETRLEKWMIGNSGIENDKLTQAQINQLINSLEPIITFSCTHICQIWLIQPMIKFSQEHGFIKVSLPIEHSLNHFNQLTNVHIFAMIYGEEDINNLGKVVINNQEYGVNYTSSYTAYEALTERFRTLEFGVSRNYKHENKYYEVTVITPDVLNISDEITIIFSQDITRSYQIFLNTVKRMSLVSLLIIVIALFILYPLLRTVSSRLQDLMNVLPLIGEKKFDVVRDKLRKYLFKPENELNNVLVSAFDLNGRLDTLHHELDIANNRLQKALNDTEQRHDYISSILNTAESFIVTCSVNGKITTHNNFAEKLIGKDKDQLIDMSIFDVLSMNKTTLNRLNNFFALKSGQKIQFNAHAKNMTSTKVVPMSFSCSYIKTLNQFLFVGIDITENVLREEKIQRIADIDEITGLYNRRKFWFESEKLLHQYQSNDKFKEHKIAFMFIDVDRFKVINDRWGHDFGNMLLNALGDKFRQFVTKDSLIARIGGDEFMIAFVATSVNQIHTLAEKIEQEIRGSRFIFNEVVVRTTLSIGVSIFPDHGTSLDKLISFADVAMYENKLTRLGGVAIYSGYERLTLESRAEDEWNKKIKEVIDKELISCHFQPVVTADNHQITHFEVLTRIKSDDEISISEFFYYCEKSYMVPYVDRLVIHDGLKKISPIKDAGCKYMFNVSLITLTETGFVEFFIEQLKNYEIEPDKIVIEITESRQIDYYEKIIQIITQLKTFGISFALDDYGEGYTSLYYLTKLPIDYLKLDICLISDVKQNEVSLEIVKSIIALCRKLNITTIAEGVEDNAQITILQDIGLDLLQGYYFCQPVSHATMLNFYNQGEFSPRLLHSA